MHGNKKKEEVKKNPPVENWPWVDVRKQDAKFFAIVQKLHNSRFDPKFDLVNDQVNVEECYALFGGSKRFKVSTPNLKWKTWQR